MQRKIRFCILLVVFWMFCLFGCQNSSWDKVETTKSVQAGKKEEVKIYESSDMEVYLNYGFCGLVQKNESLPIEVKICTKDEWSGRIKIFLPVSSHKEASYEQKVKAKKGENKEKIIIPSIGDFSYFKVCIEDEENKTLVTTKVLTGISQEENKLYMGILSEEKEFSCFGGLKKQKGEKEAKLVRFRLDASEIPEDAERFSALDYLVVNHFSAADLSKKQRQAIKKWVKEGGILIAGTGGDDIEALDLLVDVVATRQGERKEKVLLSLYSGEEQENIILDRVSFQVKENMAYESMLDRELLKQIPYGDGAVCISELDLSDPVLKKHEQKIGKLILDQITTKRFYSIVKERESSIRSVVQALNFNYDDSMPNILIYISLFIIYIGLIGPAAYFILKHFDKKTWFFLVVFFLSCIFTVVVFYVSSDYKREMPIINILSVINTKNDDEIIYMSAQNLKKSEYSLRLLDDIDFVEALPDVSALNGTEDVYQFSEKEKKYAVEKTKNNFRIHFFGNSVLSQDILKLRREKEDDIGAFDYELNFDNDLISVKLENNTKYDFSYVLFYYQKKYWVFKDLAKNEKVTIENDDISLLDLTKNEKEYFLSKSLYPSETRKQYLELEENQKIFAFLYETMLKEEEQKGYFIGITEAEKRAILKDDNFHPKQKIAYIEPFTKEDVNGDTVMNVLEFYLQKISGDIYEGFLYSESADFSYHFLNKNSVGELIRLDDYYKGKIYIYNYKEEKYDEILASSQERLTEDKVREYVDEEGNLKIHLETREEYTQIPVIAMIEGA